MTCRAWSGSKGTDDLPDAYRQLPVAPSQQGFSVIAVHIPGTGWRFTLLRGLAFGQESAVVNFNRWLVLAIAAARRCARSVAAAYFDDELSVELLLDHDVSGPGLRCILDLMGSPPQHSKSSGPQCDPLYLGASIHLGSFLTEGVVRFQPKYLTRTKVVDKLWAAISTCSLSRDDAGKLRGDLQWLYSMCSGHLGRLAGPVLSTHHAHNDPDLNESELRLLRLLLRVVSIAQPRDVQVTYSFFSGHCVFGCFFRWHYTAVGMDRFFWNYHSPFGGSTILPDSVLAKSSWWLLKFAPQSLRARIYSGSLTTKLQSLPSLVPVLLKMMFTCLPKQLTLPFILLDVGYGLSGSIRSLTCLTDLFDLAPVIHGLRHKNGMSVISPFRGDRTVGDFGCWIGV